MHQPPTTMTATNADAAPDVEVTASGRIVVDEGAPPPAPVEADGAAAVGPGAGAARTGAAITPASDLSRPDRRIWVVSTAGLPWRTGTAVNPLLRALWLSRGRPAGAVTLLIPWLPDAAQRRKLYGAVDGAALATPADQEAWIRRYCRERCGCTAEEEARLRIRFYEGTYQESFGSIFPTRDICSLIPLEEADVAILEEPEHLNWFRVPELGAEGDERMALGWAHMFTHVVGVLHTNYAEYVREYSMGASLITAPALNSLSSLVVRAYCHQVIRLSAALPTLCDKEVTCNIHGVRPEFLQEPTPDPDRLQNNEGSLAPVYFIGKVIWAKGFDKVLELQERFKEETGDYFRIDVYGSGNDEHAIKRAFFGRKGLKSAESSTSNTPVMSDDEEQRDFATGSNPSPVAAANVFGKQESLRAMLNDRSRLPHCDTAESTDDDSDVTSNADADETPYSSDAEITSPVEPATEEAKTSQENTVLSILSDASEKALSTGIETAGATASLIESAMTAVFSRKMKQSKEPSPRKRQNRLNLVPVRARYKWRSTPLPARFLGTKDHILIRDIPEHSIFLNMSTTEVLCTTSAEALAMGKYVILPKHPSNEFFYQFPNCLAYEDIDDCVMKLQYALSNRPEYLLDKHVHALSWLGATERLFQAAAITEAEQARRLQSGMIEADFKAAKFHVDSASKSQMVKNIISGGSFLPTRNSSASLKEDSEKTPANGAASP